MAGICVLQFDWLALESAVRAHPDLIHPARRGEDRAPALSIWLSLPHRRSGLIRPGIGLRQREIHWSTMILASAC